MEPGLFISPPRVCVFNTHKAPSLNLRHGRGSLAPALPPARAPPLARPHGGAVVRAGRLSLGPPHGTEDRSPPPPRGLGTGLISAGGGVSSLWTGLSS